MPTSNPNPTSLTNIYRFGNSYYSLKILFNNHLQDEYNLLLFEEIQFEDNMLLWPINGHIIINNTAEAFERATPKSNINGFHYIRSDARDEISIEMYPLNEFGTGADARLKPDKVWRFKFTCVIYDVEDIPSTNNVDKRKKLYFCDKEYEFFLEKKVQWSTFDYTNNTNILNVHKSDTERSLPTGTIIKQLLLKGGVPSLQIDDANWDDGCCSIPFATRSDYSLWDNLQYVLAHHISKEEKDVCILSRDLYTREFTLMPMCKYFNEAGKTTPGNLQREHLFFEGMMTDNGRQGVSTNTTPYKAPISSNVNTEIDMKSNIYSRITSYKFAQMSGADNAQRFVSKPVHSYNPITKRFTVDVIENDIKTIREGFFKTKYVDKMYGRAPEPLFVLNKTKLEQISIDNKFSPYYSDREIRSLKGKGETLIAGIFLNNCLVIELRGLPNRRSGTFIAIDRSDSQSSDTVYDETICGQYLVTNVQHLITTTDYTNKLTLVKIHSYQKTPFSGKIETIY